MATITRQVKIIYTPEQLTEIRRVKCEQDKELYLRKKEFKAKEEAFKMELKPVEMEVKQLFQKLLDGYHYEERQVEEYFDHENKTVEYYDGEELVDSRPMTISEVQQYSLFNRKAV